MWQKMCPSDWKQKKRGYSPPTYTHDTRQGEKKKSSQLSKYYSCCNYKCNMTVYSEQRQPSYPQSCYSETFLVVTHKHCISRHICSETVQRFQPMSKKLIYTHTQEMNFGLSTSSALTSAEVFQCWFLKFQFPLKKHDEQHVLTVPHAVCSF